MQTLLIIYKWQKTIVKQHHLTDNSCLILNQGPSTSEVTNRSFFFNIFNEVLIYYKVNGYW